MAMTTRYKEKPPSHLSYPVGLELLATELGQIPQGDKLSISFHANAGRVTEIENKRRSGAYYPVLVARFDHSPLGLSECNELREHGCYDPKWDIIVYAVSRRHRAVARTLLRDQGIPAVAAWLRTPRTDTWLQGRKEITVCFSEKDQSILVEEDRAR